MSSDRQNATLYAGDDAILSVKVVDEFGKPLSLDGTDFSWSLSKTAGSTAVLTKTTAAGGGVVLTHPLSGMLTVNIDHADTLGLLGSMWHQLVMTDVNGAVSTVTTGTLTFKARS